MSTTQRILNPIQMAASILGITLIRTFLENFSNPEPLAGFTSFLLIVNYFLFYCALVITLGIILGYFTKQPFLKTTELLVRGLPIIWLPPIIDLIISGGACMSYLSNPGLGLLRDFLTIGGPFSSCGATIGIRIEIIIIIVFIAKYIYKKTSSIPRAFFGGLISYTAIFIQSALPGIMLTLTNLSHPLQLLNIFSQSLLGSIHTLSNQAGVARQIEQIAIVMARIPWIISLVGIAIISFYDHYEKFIVWIKNARVTRITYYSLIGIAGVLFAIKHTGAAQSYTFVDILSFIILAMSIWVNGWLAGIINDYSDRNLDKESDQWRPVAKELVTTSELVNIGGVFTGALILGGILINWNVAMFLIIAQTAYALYSLEPFRYKKHFLSSSFFVGLAGVSIFLAGYFTVSPMQGVGSLPYLVIFYIFITLAILSNAKDFKDVSTDKAHNIKTLPVVLGKRRAGHVLNLITVLWIVIMGVVFKSWLIGLQVLPWILLGTVIKKPIPEYIRFIILFGQIILLMLFL